MNLHIKTIYEADAAHWPNFDLEVIALSHELKAIYDGNFFWPKATADRPGIISNFISTRDGFVSFNLPGKMHAGFIAGNNQGDKFIMGLSRTLASVNKDETRGAIMNGANTLNQEKDVIMTAKGIYPAAFGEYKAYLETQVGQPFKNPPLIFTTGTGQLELDATVFKEEQEIETFVLTTESGKSEVEIRIKNQPRGYVPPKIVALGNERFVDLKKAMEFLRKEMGITRLLTEGGARLFGELHREKLIQVDLQTISGLIAGNDRNLGKGARTSLAEGVPFTPEEAPRTIPLSIKTDGEFIYHQFWRK